MQNQRLSSQFDLNENTDNEVCHNLESRATRALWRAVITQALMDAASKSKKSSHKLHKRQALKWLRGRSDDFVHICTLAEMDPNYVIYKSRVALQRGCKWREDNTKSKK